MVGLQRASANEHPSALLLGLRNQELQLAGLVAAERETGLVVTLDEDTRPAQCRREPRQFFDGGWQMSELRPRDHRSFYGMLVERLAGACLAAYTHHVEQARHELSICLVPE